jgi:hypothetical protein
MEEHGGRVEIESSTAEEIGPGAKTPGTTVRLLVPLGGIISGDAVSENTRSV